MIQITTCPHCGAHFEMDGDTLSVINVACAAGVSQGVVVGDFRLWFTGYKLDSNTIDMVGQCVAWIDNQNSKTGPCYVAIPVVEPFEPSVVKFNRGDSFHRVDGLPTTDLLINRELSSDLLVGIKDRAMKVLLDYIRALPGKEGESSGNQNSKM